jgi:hypothetical protein
VAKAGHEPHRSVGHTVAREVAVHLPLDEPADQVCRSRREMLGDQHHRPQRDTQPISWKDIRRGAHRNGHVGARAHQKPGDVNPAVTRSYDQHALSSESKWISELRRVQEPPPETRVADPFRDLRLCVPTGGHYHVPGVPIAAARSRRAQREAPVLRSDGMDDVADPFEANRLRVSVPRRASGHVSNRGASPGALRQELLLIFGCGGCVRLYRWWRRPVLRCPARLAVVGQRG